MLFLLVAFAVEHYNVRHFGSLQGEYATRTAIRTARAGTTVSSVVEGVLGLLVSPSRGLLVYCVIAEGRL